ncbi:Neuronal calcium sensor 2 [Brachionus plicatilis]|uniref:Neuronal calcium sensor 2 n=1 Tax=Brachionus plicatilis TaxID=10195 RepID=A0A3M7S5T1_BRAPC|nr:Neuronal calcium sensor 2 [Brachionus plicatilis]RNA31174.1 Neuronal calcium sensor 2 [Brachionus plicatilis]
MGNKKSTPRNYLSEKDLMFLESNTNFNREKIIQWHNAFLIDCPNGKLDKKQFIKLYLQLEPTEGKAEKYAEYVFKAFDSDHSGFIDFTEFLLAFNIRSKGNLEARLSWTFNLYDLDNNGQIDKKELKKMFQVLFTMLNVNKKDERYNVEKRIEEILKKYDVSGDKKLSHDEFVQGIKNDEPLQKLLLDHQLD